MDKRVIAAWITIVATLAAAFVVLGVLLDTFLVRTLLIPAISTTTGDLIWWPNTLAHRSAHTPELASHQS